MSDGYDKLKDTAREDLIAEILGWQNLFAAVIRKTGAVELTEEQVQADKTLEYGQGLWIDVRANGDTIVSLREDYHV